VFNIAAPSFTVIVFPSHPYFQLTSSPPSPSIYRYKQLKKILKKCKTQSDQDQDSPTQNPQSSIDNQAEDAFFHELQSQLISTSQHFESGTKAILSSYQSLQRRRSTFSFLAACIRFASSKSTTHHHHRTADLAEKAYWCRKYARANAVALRKILKKHDKLCDNSKGREFLAECWAANPRSAAGTAGMFLHSPLLDELLAVQSVLQTQLAQYQSALEDNNNNNNNNKNNSNQTDGGGEEVGGDDGTKKGRIVAVRRVSKAAVRRGGGGGDDDNYDTDSMHSGILSSANLQRFDEQNNQQGRQNTTASLHSASRLGTISNNNDANHHHQDGGGSEMTMTDDNGTDNSYMMSTMMAGCPSSSLHIQRQRALNTMQECPTFLLDTSDFEWASSSTDVRGGSGGGGQRLGGRNNNGSRKSFLLGTPGFILREEEEEEETDGDGEGMKKEQDDDDDDEGNKGMVGEEDAAATCGISSFSADDLKCPICLDIMYKPIGLACGHKFCRQCALESAGFGHAFGAFHNIISYVPRKTPCPQCRQVGVYQDAVVLKELGNLIKSRFPVEYGERAEEDKARRKALALVSSSSALSRRDRRGSRSSGSRGWLSPYDFLLGNAVAD